MIDWAEKLSTPERAVKAHFITVSLQDIQHPDMLNFFNQIHASFSLNDEQVDKLIKAGRELLRDNTEFQQLLSDIGA
jgi:NTE family protein